MENHAGWDSAFNWESSPQPANHGFSRAKRGAVLDCLCSRAI